MDPTYQTMTASKLDMASLERKIIDAENSWQAFVKSQSSYVSLLRLNGKPIQPPLMTADKRRKMQMFRKQACIAEVRKKSRSREKEFLSKVQTALDEIGSYQVDSSISEITSSSMTTPRDFQSVIEKVPEVPPLDLKSLHTEPETDEEGSQESPAVIESPTEKIFTQQIKKAKVHRRRFNSEGKSDTETQTSMTNNLKKSSKHYNSQPTLHKYSEAFPSSAHNQLNVNSASRQRYREEKAKQSRASTPTPAAPENKAKDLSRPASTPPVISTHSSSPSKANTCIPTQNLTVSSKALKSLLHNLNLTHDDPSRQWLTERVAGTDCDSNIGDISLEDWFQNAPDSVKQKLLSLLPSVTDIQTDEAKISQHKSADIQVSAVHTCDSYDDTLRSTSPIPNECRDIPQQKLFNEAVTQEEADEFIESALVVVDKSPRLENNILNTRSHTKHSMCNTENSEYLQLDDVPSASERRRTLSMQSYTLDEPSQALLNSALNESNRTPDTKNVEKSPTHQPSSGKTSHSKQKSKIPTFDASSVFNQASVPSTPVIHSRPSTGQKKKHMLVQRVLEESLGMRPLTPSPPERAMTPTPPDRPKSEMGTRCSRSKARYRIATGPVRPDSPLLSEAAPQRRLEFTPDRVKVAVERSRSCKIPRPGKSESSQNQALAADIKVKRSASFGQVEDRSRSYPFGDIQEESPLKPIQNDDMRAERLSKARKQLALLKSKFSLKMLKESTNMSSRENSAKRPESSDVIIKNSHQEPDEASSTVGKENFVKSSTAKHGAELNHEDIPVHVVNTYSEPENSEYSEFSSYGGILSVSHRTNRASPAVEMLTQDSSSNARKVTEDHTMRSKEQVISSSGSIKLAALIKGHLCRKLLECNKVKSLAKTIRDCENLLNTLTPFSKNSSLREVNFQERLRQQLEAARRDFHHIIFNTTTSQKFQLIKQSEKMNARQKSRTTRESRKVQSKPIKVKVKTNNNNNNYSIYTKPVLVPQKSTASPMKAFASVTNAGLS